MLLSAVSVLVVAQSSSEIPEGLMNNPVLRRKPKISHIYLDVLEEVLLFKNTKVDFRVQKSPPLELVLGFLSWYEINGKFYLNKPRQPSKYVPTFQS